MRKILMSGALALAAALAGGTPSIQGPASPTRRRGKGKGRVERIMGLHRRIFGSSRPESSRHWHNPKDPVQAKRERKAEIAIRNAERSYVNNHAWAFMDGFSPFEINREVSA